MKENDDGNEIISGFSRLQFYVYDNLKNGTITREDVVEMCKHFLGNKLCIESARQILEKEILSTMTEEAAIEFMNKLEPEINGKLEK